MSKIDEIAARLATAKEIEADMLARGGAIATADAQKNEDIAYLLAEVKRLEGMLTGEVMDNCRLRTELSEAEGLALSLAEALERGRDYLVALEENIIRNDVDMHIDACPPPSAVARDMSAALSSPALLKLKGAV